MLGPAWGARAIDVPSHESRQVSFEHRLEISGRPVLVDAAIGGGGSTTDAIEKGEHGLVLVFPVVVPTIAGADLRFLRPLVDPDLPAVLSRILVFPLRT